VVCAACAFWPGFLIAIFHYEAEMILSLYYGVRG
jgi:hypothetical protein